MGKQKQIDFAMSNQRGIVTNCEVITKADVQSDNRLVRMTLRIDKRLARLLKTIPNPYAVPLPKKQTKKLFSINTQNLKGMKEILKST